ncbi:MAG: hypothetical protein ACLQDY_17740 [Streptosporangiaceae bacterium]
MAEDADKRKLTFSDDDKKLALVTFAATTAANVVTLVIAGLAVLAYKWDEHERTLHPHRTYSIFNWHEELVTAPAAVVAAVLFVVFFVSRRRVLRQVAAGLFIVWAAIALLSLIFAALVGLGALTASH